jgi:hypothetical protein
MEKRSEALAVLQSADHLVASYLSTEQAQRHRHFIDQLWAEIAPRDPRSYRGIACILPGIPPSPDGNQASWLATLNVDLNDPLFHARLAVGRFTEHDLADTNGDLLSTLEQVQQVLALAPSLDLLEAVAVRRNSFITGPSVLGFDVGYWGGDHYSIVCDSVVTPTWHPPQPDDFQLLASLLGSLNEHLLFPTADAAITFRSRYTQFPWAETESYPGEFEVVQLAAIDARRPTSR